MRDRAGAMTAHVEEAAQSPIVVYEQQRLATEARREIVAGVPQLLCVADELPRSGEYSFVLARETRRIDVEGSGGSLHGANSTP
jgi:hypothetical protein